MNILMGSPGLLKRLFIRDLKSQWLCSAVAKKLVSFGQPGECGTGSAEIQRDGLWTEPMRKQLASSKLSRRQRLVVRSAACGTLVADQVLERWGYNISGRCKHCLARDVDVKDTVQHRAWDCPFGAQRSEFAPAALLKEAKENSTNPLFTFG